MTRQSPPRMEIALLFPAEYPLVFLAVQMPRGFVAVRCQKTQQKINAILPRVQRALLTHWRRRSPRVRRVGSLSRRYHRVCTHYLPMCASQSGYYLAI
jgi:hypothetical protein